MSSGSQKEEKRGWARNKTRQGICAETGKPARCRRPRSLPGVGKKHVGRLVDRGRGSFCPQGLAERLDDVLRGRGHSHGRALRRCRRTSLPYNLQLHSH